MAEGEPAVDRRQARIAMTVLFAVATLNLLDRNILLILQEPIRRELALSDGQLGALTGLSFALVYSLLAFPIARLADRSVRRTIVGASVIVWSAMTALSGAATSFAALVALRMGVAAGEAGSVPASHSLIADLYPPARRPMAYAVWQLSNPLGTILAYLGGGWLAYRLGWRGALVTLGIGGVGLGLLSLLLREPERGRFDPVTAEAVPDAGGAATILQSAPFRNLLIGAALHAFAMYSIQSWSAPFYIRVFGLPVERVALYLSVVVGLAGAVGAIGAGLLLRRLGPRSLRWYMRVPAIADLVMIPLVVAQFLVGDARLSLAIGFFASVAMTLFATCMTTTAQTIMPSRLCATATAASAFAISIGGLAFGPPVTGLVSDWLRHGYGMGDESLRYAVIASLVTAPFAALFFLRAARHLPPTLGPA